MPIKADGGSGFGIKPAVTAADVRGSDVGRTGGSGVASSASQRASEPGECASWIGAFAALAWLYVTQNDNGSSAGRLI